MRELGFFFFPRTEAFFFGYRWVPGLKIFILEAILPFLSRRVQCVLRFHFILNVLGVLEIELVVLNFSRGRSEFLFLEVI